MGTLFESHESFDLWTIYFWPYSTLWPLCVWPLDIPLVSMSTSTETLNHLHYNYCYSETLSGVTPLITGFWKWSPGGSPTSAHFLGLWWLLQIIDNTWGLTASFILSTPSALEGNHGHFQSLQGPLRTWSCQGLLWGMVGGLTRWRLIQRHGGEGLASLGRK